MNTQNRGSAVSARNRRTQNWLNRISSARKLVKKMLRGLRKPAPKKVHGRRKKFQPLLLPTGAPVGAS